MSTILLSFAGATAPTSSDQVAGSVSNQLTWSGALVIHTFRQCNPGSSMDTLPVRFFRRLPNAAVKPRSHWNQGWSAIGFNRWFGSFYNYPPSIWTDALYLLNFILV